MKEVEFVKYEESGEGRTWEKNLKISIFLISSYFLLKLCNVFRRTNHFSCWYNISLYLALCRVPVKAL
jgi:hypothetical protein